MRAASLNYRDLMVATGRYARGAAPARPVPLSDGAGEVVEIGPDVTRVKPGDRVAGIFMQSWLGGEIEPADGAELARRRDRRRARGIRAVRPERAGAPARASVVRGRRHAALRRRHRVERAVRRPPLVSGAERAGARHRRRVHLRAATGARRRGAGHRHVLVRCQAGARPRSRRQRRRELQAAPGMAGARFSR